MDRSLPREMGLAMRGAAERTVLPAARAAAPHRTGHLATSLKVSARGTKVAITSRLPYANVVHWGGTTGRGHQRGSGRGSVKVRANPFALRAIETTSDAFMNELADSLDAFFTRHGWK